MEGSVCDVEPRTYVSNGREGWGVGIESLKNLPGGKKSEKISKPMKPPTKADDAFQAVHMHLAFLVIAGGETVADES